MGTRVLPNLARIWSLRNLESLYDSAQRLLASPSAPHRHDLMVIAMGRHDPSVFALVGLVEPHAEAQMVGLVRPRVGEQLAKGASVVDTHETFIPWIAT